MSNYVSNYKPNSYVKVNVEGFPDNYQYSSSKLFCMYFSLEEQKYPHKYQNNKNNHNSSNIDKYRYKTNINWYVSLTKNIRQKKKVQKLQWFRFDNPEITTNAPAGSSDKDDDNADKDDDDDDDDKDDETKKPKRRKWWGEKFYSK